MRGCVNNSAVDPRICGLHRRQRKALGASLKLHSHIGDTGYYQIIFGIKVCIPVGGIDQARYRNNQRKGSTYNNAAKDNQEFLSNF